MEGGAKGGGVREGGASPLKQLELSVSVRNPIDVLEPHLNTQQVRAHTLTHTP